jgi:hypothetical protein
MLFKKPSPSPDIMSQGTDVAASPAITLTDMVIAFLAVLIDEAFDARTSHSNAKMRFQSFFMLMMVQPFFLASS